MRIRSVLEEYEAQLQPTEFAGTGANSARGKGEWKVYGNGARRCKVWITGLNLSHGSVVQLSVSGRPVAELLISGGRARYQRASERGEAVPEVEAKQVLQVSYAGRPLLAGEFYSE